MTELLAKRARDLDSASAPAAKRSKKVEQGLFAAAGGNGEDWSEAAKRAQETLANKQTVFQGLLTGSCVAFSPDYLLNAIRDCATRVCISSLAKDTGEKYARQEKRLDDLERAVRDFESQLRTLESDACKFRSESSQRLAQKQDEISTVKRAKSTEEDRLRGEIDRLRQQIWFYSRLSNSEITLVSAGEFTVRVKLHQNEFVFGMKVLQDQTVDYEAHSFSVAQTRVPEVLTQAINVDQRDVPDVLLAVLNVLM